MFTSFVVLTSLGVALPITTASADHSSVGVSFRAVLCFAPRFAPAASPPPTVAGALPKCAPSYRLTSKNLDVNVNVGTTKTIEPDPIFRNVPNDVHNQNRSEVILPGIKGATETQRYVVGAAQMTRSAIKSATVERLSGQWVVSYTLTRSGSATWNSFAKRQFHELIAIVANREVYSAPIIQPSQASFTSFEGAGMIEGNFTKAQARQLASQM
jgi:preprotein translocase subunit SecD